MKVLWAAIALSAAAAPARAQTAARPPRPGRTISTFRTGGKNR